MISCELAENKKQALDAFYLIRGIPHGFVRHGCRYALYDHLIIAFPLNEDPSFDDVWLREVYHPYVPQSQDVVIDVGAHMGFFTLKIVRNVKAVIAIEPNRLAFAFLTFNVRQNKVDKKVTLCNLALSQRDGPAFLDRSGYGAGRSRITSKRTSFPTITRRLDNLVDELGLDQIDVIKIDTEGEELHVLQGASRTLKRHKPDLLIAAYHFSDEYLTIARYLKQFEYNIFCYSIPLTLSRIREVYLFATPITR